MIDFGALSTALGMLITAVSTAYITVKTLRKDEKHIDLDHSLTHENQHFQHEKEWRAELMDENDKLRQRAEKKMQTIENLMDERHKLLQTITDQAITIKELEHLIKNLRQIIETLKGISNDPARSSQQSLAQIAPKPSDDNNPERAQPINSSTG